MIDLKNSIPWWCKIKQLRAETNQGLTQEKAALKAGVSKRTWERWEKGEYVPLLAHQEQVASAFGVERLELFGRDPKIKGEN